MKQTSFVCRPHWVTKHLALSNPAKIQLTFDDGPDPNHTPRILELLAIHHVKATFYVVGHLAERSPDLIRRIVAEGHTLGNHSHTHPRFHWWEMKRPYAEFMNCHNRLSAITNARISRIRPPYGTVTPGLICASIRLNSHMQLWTLDSNDWKIRTDEHAQQCAEELIRTALPGDVILMHDNQAKTPAILGQFLAYSGARIRRES